MPAGHINRIISRADLIHWMPILRLHSGAAMVTLDAVLGWKSCSDVPNTSKQGPTVGN